MPQRIGELAVLPVFFKLEGRKVILAGGTKAAAWKAELLAASGADVHIYAEVLEPGFAKLITDRSYKGSFTHHGQSWQSHPAHIFQNAELAICDAEGIEAESFYAAVKSVGIPVNIIDKPALCDFQFGSIVNRSPVVVSISTDGAAPILGQAIRRRIEALLPQSLSRWASLAATIRKTVNERLKPGAPRRAFWQNFSHRAFAATPAKASVTQLVNSIRQIDEGNSPQDLGRVTHLQTDPRDAEMLTLKAVRILQAADVILYDSEISPDILELARREAEHICVHADSRPADNNADNNLGEGCNRKQVSPVMKALVKTGKNVVRLKANNVLQFNPAHNINQDNINLKRL